MRLITKRKSFFIFSQGSFSICNLIRFIDSFLFSFVFIFISLTGSFLFSSLNSEKVLLFFFKSHSFVSKFFKCFRIRKIVNKNLPSFAFFRQELFLNARFCTKLAYWTKRFFIFTWPKSYLI